MPKKIAINGCGRMGRLALRAAWDWPEFEIVQVNEISGTAETVAHLLNFDSVHGQWAFTAEAGEQHLLIDQTPVKFTQQANIEDVDWSDCDIVVDCTGKHKTTAQLEPYLAQGVKKVVVSAPVKEDSVLNIVMGVNDHLYRADTHHIVTAASCTTNCLAPVVKALHDSIGIAHGSITTIHNVTNTQSILDQPLKDLRRSRACNLSLIPTSTGSASAIGLIFPELNGKLNGIAVRVPLANASIVDCVFEMQSPTTEEEVNALLKQASEHELKGILGYEERPLVSVDYTNDKRSGIVDALSTMVVNKTQVKVLAWYDNEIGYVNRMMELVKKIVQTY